MIHTVSKSTPGFGGTHVFGNTRFGKPCESHGFKPCAPETVCVTQFQDGAVVMRNVNGTTVHAGDGTETNGATVRAGNGTEMNGTTVRVGEGTEIHGTTVCVGRK